MKLELGVISFNVFDELLSSLQTVKPKIVHKYFAVCQMASCDTVLDIVFVILTGRLGFVLMLNL